MKRIASSFVPRLRLGTHCTRGSASILLFTLALSLCPANAVQKPSTPEARAKIIAPFVDDQTLVVVNVDPSRIHLDALAAPAPVSARHEQPPRGSTGSALTPAPAVV